LKVLCIIPARGGSKSIPKKNIRIINGYPLIKYTIDYALKSQLLNKVIVSTDDSEIAEIAQQLGAEIPFLRPSEFSADDSQDYVVLKHALDWYDAKKCFYDYLVLLRPTSPLRKPGLIENAMNIMNLYPDATSLRSVAKVSEHPYRMWIQKGNFISGLFENDQLIEPYNIPRQLLPPIYFQTGDIEVIRTSTIRNGSVSGPRILPLFIDQCYVDIDNESDLIHAASLMLKKNGS